MTDAELSVAVARKMGTYAHVAYPHGVIVDEYPSYATEISAAWEIVEWIIKTGRSFALYVNSGKHWTCSIGSWGNVDPDAEVNLADTASKAICLAFLKLNEPKENS